MKRVVTLANLLHLWLLCVVANSYVAVEAQPLLLIAIVPAFLLFHLLVKMPIHSLTVSALIPMSLAIFV